MCHFLFILSVSVWRNCVPKRLSLQEGLQHYCTKERKGNFPFLLFFPHFMTVAIRTASHLRNEIVLLSYLLLNKGTKWWFSLWHTYESPCAIIWILSCSPFCYTFPSLPVRDCQAWWQWLANRQLPDWTGVWTMVEEQSMAWDLQRTRGETQENNHTCNSVCVFVFGGGGVLKWKKKNMVKNKDEA